MPQQQTVMLNSRPQDAYRKQDVMTATAENIVVMLYDALKKNIILGRKGIAKKDVEAAHKHLVKAQQIVTELVSSLNMNYEISEGLLSIYEFMIINLGDANIRKDAAPLEIVIEMTDSLRSAWHEASQSSKGSLYKSNAEFGMQNAE